MLSIHATDMTPAQRFACMHFQAQWFSKGTDTDVSPCLSLPGEGQQQPVHELGAESIYDVLDRLVTIRRLQQLGGQ